MASSSSIKTEQDEGNESKDLHLDLSTNTSLSNAPLMVENSHLIEVYSNTSTIWRGNEWTTIMIDVIVDERIRKSPRSIVLRTIIEKSGSKDVYSPWESDKLKVKFDKYSLDQTWNAQVVANDARNRLQVDVHKTLFSDGDKFRIIVGAECKEGQEGGNIIFGASQVISVTNLALSIESCFDNNDKIIKIDKNVFVYYNKLASSCGGPEITISLLDEDGAIWSHHDLPAIPLETQLVYENGIPVPIMPIRPLRVKPRKKDEGSIVRSAKPIFIRDDPVLEIGQSSTKLVFDLEEVTYHHHGHDGFKVRVSTKKGQKLVVHPTVMKELIVVLSKPKKVSTVEKFEELSSNKSQEEEEDRTSRKPKLLVNQVHCSEGNKKRKATDLSDEVELPLGAAKKFKVSCDATTLDQDEKNEEGPQHAIKLIHILEAYRFNDKCFQCNAPVTTQSILRSYCHTVDCTFAANIIPLFKDVDLSLLKDKEKCSASIPAIMESKSFEESCKRHVANSPCEMVDKSIFGPSSSMNHSDDDADDEAPSLPIMSGNTNSRNGTNKHALDLWNTSSFFDIMSTNSIFNGVQSVKEEVITTDNMRVPFSSSSNDNEGEKDNSGDNFLGFLDNLAKGEDEISFSSVFMKQNADGSL